MFNLSRKQSSSGFTLLEVLLVIALIAILAGIIIVAINPAKQLASARNTDRMSDIRQIDSAINQYYIDNFEFPATLPSSLTEICNTGSLSDSTVDINDVLCTTNDLVNLSALVPDYIVAIPVDPQGGNNFAFLNKIIPTAYAVATEGTGYSIMKNANNRITTQADNAELNQTIAIGPDAAGGSSTLGDGLVAHYLMNDADCTTVANTKGASGSGICTSAAGARGNTGTSLSFSGSTDDWVDISNAIPSTATPNFTIAAWVYENTTAPNVNWIGASTLSPDIRLMSFNYDAHQAMTFILQGSPNYSWLYAETDNSTVTAGAWYHIVLVAESGAPFKIYINGAEVNYQHQDTAENVDLSSFTNLVLAANAYQGSLSASGFNGLIDDVRIYNRVLTQGEITALAAGTEAE